MHHKIGTPSPFEQTNAIENFTFPAHGDIQKIQNFGLNVFHWKCVHSCTKKRYTSGLIKLFNRTGNTSTLCNTGVSTFLVQIDKKVITKIAKGDESAEDDPILKTWCGKHEMVTDKLVNQTVNGSWMLVNETITVKGAPRCKQKTH